VIRQEDIATIVTALHDVVRQVWKGDAFAARHVGLPEVCTAKTVPLRQIADESQNFPNCSENRSDPVSAVFRK
jgi:hypothetical protein